MFLGKSGKRFALFVLLARHLPEVGSRGGDALAIASTLGRKGPTTMADRLAAMEAQEDEIFVYMGGHQVVPDGVRRARIHEDVKIVRAWAFISVCN